MRYAIIGNAPPAADFHTEIEAADCVVRFNACPYFGAPTGTRTDLLVLCNIGVPAREIMASAQAGNPVFQAARAFRFSIAPRPLQPADLLAGRWSRKAREDDVTAEIRALIVGDRPVDFIPRSSRRGLLIHLARLGAPAGSVASIGALTLHDLLYSRSRRADRIDIYGFTHQGWAGHAWEAERAYFDELEAAGRLRRRA